jgi:hypothetical protein
LFAEDILANEVSDVFGSVGVVAVFPTLVHAAEEFVGDAGDFDCVGHGRCWSLL